MRKVLAVALALFLILGCANAEELPDYYNSADDCRQIGEWIEVDDTFALCVNKSQMISYWDYMDNRGETLTGTGDSYPQNCLVTECSIKNIGQTPLDGHVIEEVVHFMTFSFPSISGSDITWHEFDFSADPKEILELCGINIDYDATKVLDDQPWSELSNLSEVIISPGEMLQVVFLKGILTLDSMYEGLTPAYLETRGKGAITRVRVTDPCMYFSDGSFEYSYYILDSIYQRLCDIFGIPFEEYWNYEPSQREVSEYVKRFQKRLGFPETGDLDWETIKWLDYEWNKTL